MRVRASSCSHCRITYKCNTCDCTGELYHEMCTYVLQSYFEEKDVLLKYGVCGICKLTQCTFHFYSVIILLYVTLLHGGGS